MGGRRDCVDGYLKGLEWFVWHILYLSYENKDFGPLNPLKQDEQKLGAVFSFQLFDCGHHGINSSGSLCVGDRLDGLQEHDARTFPRRDVGMDISRPVHPLR